MHQTTYGGSANCAPISLFLSLSMIVARIEKSARKQEISLLINGVFIGTFAVLLHQQQLREKLKSECNGPLDLLLQTEYVTLGHNVSSEL